MAKVVSVTDDERSFILRFRLTLQRVGISVGGFKDYTDADTFINSYLTDKRSGDPHEVIFLDINIKGSRLNGLEILQELRQKYNGEPVIAIVSTSARKEEIDRAKALGADCYIVKTGALQTFADRMAEFKRDFIDQRIKEFRVYGQEDVI